MTYEEFRKVYAKLLYKGFVSQAKPIWDMDIYEMVDEINKESSTIKELQNDR